MFRHGNIFVKYEFQTYSCDSSVLDGTQFYFNYNHRQYTVLPVLTRNWIRWPLNQWKYNAEKLFCWNICTLYLIFKKRLRTRKHYNFTFYKFEREDIFSSLKLQIESYILHKRLFHFLTLQHLIGSTYPFYSNESTNDGIISAFMTYFRKFKGNRE